MAEVVIAGVIVARTVGIGAVTVEVVGGKVFAGEEVVVRVEVVGSQAAVGS